MSKADQFARDAAPIVEFFASPLLLSAAVALGELPVIAAYEFAVTGGDVRSTLALTAAKASNLVAYGSIPTLFLQAMADTISAPPTWMSLNDHVRSGASYVGTWQETASALGQRLKARAVGPFVLAEKLGNSALAATVFGVGVGAITTGFAKGLAWVHGMESGSENFSTKILNGYAHHWPITVGSLTTAMALALQAKDVSKMPLRSLLSSRGHKNMASKRSKVSQAFRALL